MTLLTVWPHMYIQSHVLMRVTMPDFIELLCSSDCPEGSSRWEDQASYQNMQRDTTTFAVHKRFPVLLGGELTPL